MIAHLEGMKSLIMMEIDFIGTKILGKGIMFQLKLIGG